MIGKRIREQRVNKGLSLSQLAIQAGVAKSYLSSLERGQQQNPSIEILKKISIQLNVDIDSLIGEGALEHERTGNVKEKGEGNKE
ncbi:helix-turn-helix domain-containing protein [Mesobacillus maritimus]|uniref:Helix-turn-helix transcriptional regulator n=1 Tax=Mesobacillus maritimus TaxID=1643336 RepID=A0ABS7K4U4_9BACI|nr:helix-turn-helix transcriptional regulator [Mesobacillus maritimus]MBY0097287.1 helix-turn-helix transcriptional regulator [Mesobacillus maritimus]